MARREKLQALVLGRKSYGEADRLVTLFTREAGLLRVMAKGVRKIPSRRGGHLEPFTKVLAVVNAARDWRYLAHIETLDYFSALHSAPASLQHAEYVGRLLLGVMTENEPASELFDYLEGMWRELPHRPFAKQALMEITAAMIILLTAGVIPNLSACQRCGRPLPEDALILDGQEGGWHCLSCHGAFSGAKVSLTPRLLKVLQYVIARPAEALRLRLTDDEGYQLLAAMRSYTGTMESVISPLYA